MTKRETKGAALMREYLAMLEEPECRCGYFISARRHQDPTDRDYHPIDVVPKQPITPELVF